jgi:hypothetical protein
LLCGDQEPKLTPEQFGEAVASGEVFEAAREALQAAIVDFTPPSQRPMLLKVLETEKAEQQARDWKKKANEYELEADKIAKKLLEGQVAVIASSIVVVIDVAGATHAALAIYVAITIDAPAPHAVIPVSRSCSEVPGSNLETFVPCFLHRTFLEPLVTACGSDRL